MTPADSSLERYAADIRRTVRLGEEEERELLDKARKGSLPARNRLILAHMRFVLKVALHYRNGPVPVADLVGEGVLGLVRAVDSYEDTGIKFISYAVWWIRSQMVRAIEDKGATIRLPANEHARIRREKKAARQGCPGSEAMPRVRTVSAEGPTGLAAWEEHADPSPGPEVRLGRARLDRELGARIGSLPEKEGKVIRGLYGIESEEADTLRELAEDLGLSCERVRQMREKALRRMREGAGPALSLQEWM